MCAEVPNERASWQNMECPIRNMRFTFKINFFFCEPMACHDVLFRSTRSKPPVLSVTQDTRF